jgi:hypothetical protein
VKGTGAHKHASIHELAALLRGRTKTSECAKSRQREKWSSSARRWIRTPGVAARGGPPRPQDPRIRSPWQARGGDLSRRRMPQLWPRRTVASRRSGAFYPPGFLPGRSTASRRPAGGCAPGGMRRSSNVLFLKGGLVSHTRREGAAAHNRVTTCADVHPRKHASAPRACRIARSGRRWDGRQDREGGAGG